MRGNSGLLGHFFFFFLGAWLVSTIFIDFFAVTAVFRNVSSIYEAGKVGMYVFTVFNKFEIFFGLSILIISFMTPLSNQKIKKIFVVISAMLLGLALYYSFFLSPKITNLTEQMHAIGMGSPAYDTVEATHQIFHKRYITMDSIKLLLLLILLALGIGKGKTFRQNEGKLI